MTLMKLEIPISDTWRLLGLTQKITVPSLLGFQLLLDSPGAGALEAPWLSSKHCDPEGSELQPLLRTHSCLQNGDNKGQQPPARSMVVNTAAELLSQHRMAGGRAALGPSSAPQW